MAKLDLSVPKITGGALASVTAAVAASYLGVGGTLTGAALGSVLSSVAATFYATSLQSAGSKIRTPRSGVPSVQRSSLTVPGSDPGGAPGSGGFPAEWQQAASRPSEPQYRPRRAQPRRSISLWQPVAVMTGFAFVIAMGAIFSTELFLGHPISDAQRTGTTVGQFVAPAPPVKKPVREKKPAPDPTATITSPEEATSSPSGSATKGTEDPAGTSSTTTSSTEGDNGKTRDESSSSSSSGAEGSGEKNRTTTDEASPEPTPTAEAGQGGAADEGGDAARNTGADDRKKDQATTKDPAA
ncbi:MAG: hypothetical protein QG622_2467 [Actinomycetota bacterium]|nr:hypothetical protein [Actinomycetota bacterium]